MLGMVCLGYLGGCDDGNEIDEVPLELIVDLGFLVSLPLKPCCIASSSTSILFDSALSKKVCNAAYD